MVHDCRRWLSYHDQPDDWGGILRLEIGLLSRLSVGLERDRASWRMDDHPIVKRPPTRSRDVGSGRRKLNKKVMRIESFGYPYRLRPRFISRPHRFDRIFVALLPEGTNMQSVGTSEFNVENLRKRLQRMSDRELIQYGKACRGLVTPQANLGRPPREVFAMQLQEARKQWRRRHPKNG